MSTLATLSVGSLAQVDHVMGDDEISLRLMEMGLVPGTEVQLMSVAPFGDPLEIELRGYRLSMRKSEAERVAIVARV